MVFKTLYESALRGELILTDGALCHWHLRRDGQLTIRDIIVLPDKQKRGIGRAILAQLKKVKGAKCLLARCPSGLQANGWYEAMGFCFAGDQPTHTGGKVNIWILDLENET